MKLQLSMQTYQSHTPFIVLYSCLLAKYMHITLLIEPTHWIEAIGSSKFDMFLYTQSQVCQHKTWTAAARLTLERQQIPMSPGCHSQVIKGIQYVTVQNTSALHYEHNLWAKGKQGWEIGCSYAV